ncbi:MAG: hypothetical protein MJ221_03485 [Bacilli bacterium]|nr:hypothetical protein [Bacilli bacterium]
MKTKIYQVNGYSFVDIKTKNLDVVFCDLGASIYSIEFCGDLMALTPQNEDDFFSCNIYHGKTIGRFPNRIKGNHIELDNKLYSLENNEGPNVLHGGKSGLSTKKFSYKINENDSSVEVVFTYLSKHLESGFPGNINIQVTYVIHDSSIEIIHEATSDMDTIFSLTNHAYYNVGSPNLDNLSLCINSSRYIHPNQIDLIPEDVRLVDDSLNFKNGKKIMNNINDDCLLATKANGYDHFYIFDSININEPAISLSSDKYVMNIFTDYEGTQIYSDNYEDEIKFKNVNRKVHRGIAIEPGYMTNKITMLRKNDKYKHKIMLKFERR